MADVKLIIDYVNGNIQATANEAEDLMASAGKKGGKKFSNNFSLGAKDIKRQLGQIALTAAGLGTVSLFKGLKDASQLEVINTQFEVMLKSASAARKQVEDLQEFAASTPFQLPGLAEATKQLLSFGVVQDDVIPTLTQLGDIAAGVGADITDLTIPFGRLISTQKLTLQELDKFADRGVNIYRELANETGKSIRNIRDDISKGRVPFETFTKSLANLTGESGLFFKGMEKQSKTLNGTLSTLGDTFFNLSANIGKSFSPYVVGLVGEMTKGIKSLNTEAKQSFDAFTDIIAPLLSVAQTITTYIVPAFELLYNAGRVAFDILVAGVSTVVAGLGKLGLGISKVAGFFGVKGFLTEAIENFSDSSAAAFEEAALRVGASAEKIFDFNVSTTADEAVTDVRNLMERINAEVKAAAESEDSPGKVIAKTTEEVGTALGEQANVVSSYYEVVKGAFMGVTEVGSRSQKQLLQVAKQTNAIVKGGLVKGISGGIQNIVQSLASGENAFQNFGKFILNTFGDLAIQLGQFFIAQGIAIEALNAVSGTGAIAAGAALVALGAIIKSFSGGGAATAPATGGGDFGSFAEPAEPTDEFVDEEGTAKPTTNISLVVEGNVIDDNGSFARQLVEQIGEEGGKQGLKFDNFAAV